MSQKSVYDINRLKRSSYYQRSHTVEKSLDKNPELLVSRTFREYY